MESKLNHSSIDAYSREYAEIIASDFFTNQDVIQGRQIVELCDIRQVNFFVLKVLFQKWKKETANLQSPYFDYSEKAVSDALVSFMNVLSQHISIKIDHFEPLLHKAVYDTIILIFSPFEYFSKEINNPEKSRVNLEDLLDLSRYTKINTDILEALIVKFKSKGLKEIYNDEAYNMLIDISENYKEKKTGEQKEYQDRFSEVLPLRTEMIYEVKMEKNIEGDSPVLKPSKEINGEAEKSAKINFFNQHLTLNEKLNTKSNNPTLADLHQKKKIENIKKHISIYQRFMFINELFNGKVDEFDQAVEILDVCDNFDEALEVLKKNYVNKYRWNMEAEEVNEFLDILSKRYN
ncbi:MAG: hypothetical protein M3512_16275 [Bacteroidota bacterium]|nr:hypothetical protein [Bacteroidota bacterium]